LTKAAIAEVIAYWANFMAAERHRHERLQSRRPFSAAAAAAGDAGLAILFNRTPYRTATNWQPGGPTLRFHIGLEAVEDLTADLERGFAALAVAAQIDSH
jgi:cystathionine beta-lyase/cystathionine gamma-synthase